ncbi:hypothetical protein PoB_007442100 [Plakobranchus ocellatus]|uniref:Uncharacterized protein n=1 Tax=Plakobranchus ocellatus TaxID=259542 RepID=A0AAV4DUY9_9GAST|nr:hypothetical protein PoB_007442100 [Plakobranchus ocellatus]
MIECMNNYIWSEHVKVWGVRRKRFFYTTTGIFAQSYYYHALCTQAESLVIVITPWRAAHTWASLCQPLRLSACLSVNNIISGLRAILSRKQPQEERKYWGTGKGGSEGGKLPQGGRGTWCQ